MKGKGYIHDVSKSAFIGLAVSGVIILISAILAFFMGHDWLITILVFSRSGLCIVGSLGLFLSAALILVKKSTISEDHLWQWRKYFHRMGFAGVIIVISIAILLLAGGIDFIYFSLL
jgi:magnesium-transporting ATPase (P-type)